MKSDILRFFMVAVVSMTLLSTTCYEDIYVDEPIQSVRVDLYDNSGEYIKRCVDGKCAAEALVLMIMPQWDEAGAFYQFTDSVTGLRVMAIDVNDGGKAVEMKDLHCFIPMPTEMYEADGIVIDFKFDDSGARFERPIGLIAAHHHFCLAYLPEGEPLAGTYRFRAILDFKSGRSVAALSRIVELTDTEEK